MFEINHFRKEFSLLKLSRPPGSLKSDFSEVQILNSRKLKDFSYLPKNIRYFKKCISTVEKTVRQQAIQLQ